MDQPLISVILPIYNMELYLERCLDSVLNNTYRNLEIICIDDGSKDNSLEILRRYEATDSRIIVIAKENGGVSSARNAGLDRMTGEYVTFVDPDDFVHPQYIEHFVVAQHETGADLVIGGVLSVTENDFPIDMKAVKYDASQCWKADCVTVFKSHHLGAFCGARFIGKHLIKGIHFPIDHDYSEDTLFFAALWEQNPSINCWVINHQLYYYCIRVDSATNVVNCQTRLDALRLYYHKAAETPEFKRIWLPLGMTSSVRFVRHYNNFLHDSKSACLIAREMRAHLLSILFSPFFTAREKLFYTVKAFFPGLRSIKTILSGR